MLDFHGNAPANHYTTIEFTFEVPIEKTFSLCGNENIFWVYSLLFWEKCLISENVNAQKENYGKRIALRFY